MSGRDLGFTLPELLLVLLIVGTVAAAVAPRLSERSTVQLPGLQQELAAALRFAQKTAVAADCPIRAIVAPAGFEVRRSSTCHADDFAVLLIHPARGGPFAVAAPAGIGLSPAGSITFLGDGTASSGSVTLASATASRQVIVIGATGYVDAP